MTNTKTSEAMNTLDRECWCSFLEFIGTPNSWAQDFKKRPQAEKLE